jgi:CHAT domain-containing protein
MEPNQKQERVPSYLSGCKVILLAGHSVAHHQNPLLSHLLLAGWEIDPLTLEDLLAMNIYKQSPLLAYFSACVTGRILEGNFMDETVHPINAFQLVGFLHVLGTMGGKRWGMFW